METSAAWFNFKDASRVDSLDWDCSLFKEERVSLSKGNNGVLAEVIVELLDGLLLIKCWNE